MTASRRIMCALPVLGALLPGCSDPASPAAVFVGAESCIGCHVEEGERWRGSHHALAMQEASEATVLGDFHGDTLQLGGETYLPFRRGEAYFVRAMGPGGDPADFPVLYTFGVDPLQQYLIQLSGGRLQALTLAWDARPTEEGGQRWFDLAEVHAEPIRQGDSRHWTGADQTWNFMCADCHSTGLRKRYDPLEDRYDTGWSEINVACEACHGAGSEHVDWQAARAEGTSRGEDPGLPASLARHRPGAWTLDPNTGSPVPREGPDPGGQLDSCGFCHAHRAPLVDDYFPGQPLFDTQRPSLLEEGLYFADGQIRDEVFEWGSFRQSAMYRAGVTCSDCHDPHSLELRASGNTLCTQCHAPARFDTEEHHLQPPGTSGAACVSCHMPERTYMVVDPRRDHSFPVPRPEPARAARALAAAWAGKAGSARALAEVAADSLVAPIVRATALSLLGRDPRPEGLRAIEDAVGHADPVIRLGAARGLEGYPPQFSVPLGQGLLADSLLAIRVETARVLASVDPAQLPPTIQGVFEDALKEYRETQRVNLDRPEARQNLGWLALREGDAVAAEREYRAALRLQSDFTGGYVNLADLLRMQGRDTEAEDLLRSGLERIPGSSELRHALALTLVRLGRTPEAVPLLREASELAPRDARFAYVYAVALHSEGDTAAAVEWLEAFLEERPGNREVLLGLVGIHLDTDDRAAALAGVEALLELDPEDPEGLRLLEAARSLPR
ncbi:MAG: tetratricopeptide repeat protein [Gemmatimonadota bacterium]